jgi:hypothetical protein
MRIGDDSGGAWARKGPRDYSINSSYSPDLPCQFLPQSFERAPRTPQGSASSCAMNGVIDPSLIFCDAPDAKKVHSNALTAAGGRIRGRTDARVRIQHGFHADRRGIIGEPVRSRGVRRLSDLTDELERNGVGETVRLTVQRDGGTRMVETEVVDIGRTSL